MIICIEKESFSLIAEFFEIVTPLTLLFWFLHSRRTNSKEAYFKEFVGLYGGFVNKTINESNDKTRYDGGLIMEIFDIDENGYFRGQFEYYENEIHLGKVGGPPALEQPKHSSINFFYGQLNFQWNFKLKTPNPLLWKTNRIYEGQLKTVDRLDRLTDDENITLERVYGITHHRESKVIEFKLERINKAQFNLPKQFTLFKKSSHLLDPYTNVVKIFREPLLNER